MADKNGLRSLSIFISQEMLDDSVMGERVHEYIAERVAMEMDAARTHREFEVLYGDGSAQPVGIINPKGIEKLKLIPVREDDTSTRKRAARLD